MGNTPDPRGVVAPLEPTCLMIEENQAVVQQVAMGAR